VEILNQAGVPTGPIYSIDQAFADPQVKHLGMAQGIPLPGGGERNFVGQPVMLSRTPAKATALPPALGEHTDEVLKEFGFRADEIAELRRAGAV
jgi:formyl-CoA transferase